MMKRQFFVLLLLASFPKVHGQILDSIEAGSSSIEFSVIAPSKYEDFSATNYGNQLLFVSSRETKLFSKKDDYNNQKYFDLFLYNFDTKEVSRYGEKLKSLATLEYHLGPSVILPDSTGIILSRNYGAQKGREKVNFYLQYENWTTDEHYKLPFCDVEFSYQHPFFDASNNRLYFTSNLKGGAGGYDIYYSDLSDGLWSEPRALEELNGPTDDVFPTVAPDGTVYFSRLKPKMGLNIYAFKDGKTHEVPSPISTNGDEFSLVFLNKDTVVFSQSQRRRFDTDLVLAWVEPNENDTIEPVDSTLIAAEEIQEEEPETFELYPVEGSLEKAEEMLQTLAATTGIEDLYIGQVEGKAVIAPGSPLDTTQSNALKTEMLNQGNSIALVSSELPEELNRIANNAESYSTIAGVFKNYEGAEDRLKEVKKWSPEAYISNLNGKYYVVGYGGESLELARGDKRAANANGVGDVWIMGDELLPVWHESKGFGKKVVFNSSPDAVRRDSLVRLPISIKSNDLVFSDSGTKRALKIAEKRDGNYSTIAGVFKNYSGAEERLMSVRKWSSDAYISELNGKYYVVADGGVTLELANTKKSEGTSNGLKDLWVMKNRLVPMDQEEQTTDTTMVNTLTTNDILSPEEASFVPETYNSKIKDNYVLEGSLKQAQQNFEVLKRATGFEDLVFGNLNGVPVLSLPKTMTDAEVERLRLKALENNVVLRYSLDTSKASVVAFEGEEKLNSTIVGVFNQLENAKQRLKEVQRWAPDAYIARRDEKYNVVALGGVDREKALAVRQMALNNNVPDVWILRDVLFESDLPNTDGDPDFIIYFDFDSYVVLDKYKNQINKAIELLPPGVERVYMVGHADSRGSYRYNENLSRNRVDAVANYITSTFREFDAVRHIDFKGERELVNECADGADCDENSHLLNRRVEIWFY